MIKKRIPLFLDEVQRKAEFGQTMLSNQNALTSIVPNIKKNTVEEYKKSDPIKNPDNKTKVESKDSRKEIEGQFSRRRGKPIPPQKTKYSPAKSTQDTNPIPKPIGPEISTVVSSSKSRLDETKGDKEDSAMKNKIENFVEYLLLNNEMTLKETIQHNTDLNKMIELLKQEILDTKEGDISPCKISEEDENRDELEESKKSPWIMSPKKSTVEFPFESIDVKILLTYRQ